MGAFRGQAVDGRSSPTAQKRARRHGDMHCCWDCTQKGATQLSSPLFCSCHHQEAGTGSAPLSHSFSVPRFPRVPSTPTRPEHQGTRGLVRTEARWEQAVLIPHHPRGAPPAPTSPGRSLPHFSCRSWGWSRPGRELCRRRVLGGGTGGSAPSRSHTRDEVSYSSATGTLLTA